MHKEEIHASYWISILSLKQSFLYGVLPHICTYIWLVSKLWVNKRSALALVQDVHESTWEHSARPTTLHSSLKWNFGLWLPRSKFSQDLALTEHPTASRCQTPSPCGLPSWMSCYMTMAQLFSESIRPMERSFTFILLRLWHSNQWVWTSPVPSLLFALPSVFNNCLSYA